MSRSETPIRERKSYKMNANEMKNLAHSKMVEAMFLLQKAYEKAEMEVANAEAEEERLAAVVAKYEAMYSTFEGLPNFEADMNTAYEVYDKAWRKADLLRYDAEQIDSAMLSLREALDKIEDTYEYEGLGC